MRLSRKKIRKKYRRIVAQRQRRAVENVLPTKTTGTEYTHELGSFYASGPVVRMGNVQAKLAIAQTSAPSDQVFSGEMVLPESAVLAAGMDRVVRSKQGGKKLSQTQAVQRQPRPEEDEKNLQSKFISNKAAAQFEDNTDKAENSDNLPASLRMGLEQLSGMDLSGVRVYKNSSRPAQLNALAYTQGQDIHLGQGQEKHLPHEGWHAVQQMQGRVKPTMQAKGVSINNAKELERDADVMGAKAMAKNNARRAATSERTSGQSVIQLKKIGHRPLTWADFKGRPRRSKYEAETSSDFHDPKIRKVVPPAKSLKAVDSGGKCRLGRKTAKIYKVNIAIDLTRIKVKAYMRQERSWVKAWVRNLKARVRKCKSGLVKKCKANFVKQYRKVNKKRKKAIRACKKSYNKWRIRVIKDSNKLLISCRKALKGKGSWYEISIGGNRLRVSNKKQCRTVLKKQYRILNTRLWSYSLDFDGEKASASTKKACAKKFAKRYTKLARKSLSWTATQAGEKATITSKAACNKKLLTACKNRILPAASRQLLKHEQVHFDITEVKAREAEAKLQSLAAGFDKEVATCGKRNALRKAKKLLRKNVLKLVKVYKDMLKALKASQKTYDKNTAHGVVKEEQTKWGKTISKELNK